MGVVISKTELNPFSFTAGVIGLVSFAFTVGTFLRVIWVNIDTLKEAPHEVHAYLTLLRTELVEERTTIRMMRRQAKKVQRLSSSHQSRDHPEAFHGMLLNEVSLKTMSDTVKRLIRKFKDLERPFLEAGEAGIDEWKAQTSSSRRRRGSSASPYYEHAAYAEKGRSRTRSRGRRRRDVAAEEYELDDEDAFWAQRTAYAPFTFRLRLAWLWRKGDAQALYAALTRVQVRRTSRQVGGMSCYISHAAVTDRRTEQALRRIEDRLGNIVGVRQVS